MILSGDPLSDSVSKCMLIVQVPSQITIFFTITIYIYIYQIEAFFEWTMNLRVLPHETLLFDLDMRLNVWIS